MCLVTPVFNGAAYTDQTIASVLGQPGEFVLHYHVQDGGSTDGTQRRVRRWMLRQRLGLLPRACRGIRFTFASAPDEGMYDAVNRGFAAALPDGDDVMMGWIAADDQIAPGAFATFVAVREAYPEVRLVGGRVALLNQHGSITAIDAIRALSRVAMAAGPYDGRDGRTFVMQEGTFWCADLWWAVGGLDAGFRLAGDWDLWRRMARLADYVGVDTALGFHRRRPGQLSKQLERYHDEVDARLDRSDPRDEDQASSPVALRDEYDRVGADYQRSLSNPAIAPAGHFGGTIVRYDRDREVWVKTDASRALFEGELADMLGEGWSTPEDTHLWSIGLRSALWLGGSRAARGLRLELSGNPHVPGGRQAVRLLLNGEHAADTVLRDGGRDVLEVPADHSAWLPGRINHLSLRPDMVATPPAETGDTRPLGVCLWRFDIG